MDVDDYKELFAYNHKVRQSYVEYLQDKLPWDEIIKNRETGWLSLRNTLLHIIWAEDTWIHYSIRGMDDPRRPFPFDQYSSWPVIAAYNDEVVSKTAKYFETLTAAELDRKVTRVNKDGVRRTISVRDALFHVVTEELHHRGEIIAMLWQMDVEPPDMGWPSVMHKTDPPWKMT
jgi:uncharacterized damage-inducible protein DinB